MKSQPAKRRRRKPVELHDIMVSHLIGDEPTIGWLFSIENMARQAISSREPLPPEIAALFDLRPDIRPFVAQELITATHRAAKDACATVLAMKLDGHHPIAAIIAKAMQVMHLGWQAEVMQARDTSYFFEAKNQKMAGKASARSRRLQARARLDALARTYLALEQDPRHSIKPIRLANVAAEARIPEAKLRSKKITLKAIRRRARTIARK